MPSAAQVVSLVTFFGPAKKATRWPAGTGELDLRPLATETLIVPNQLPQSSSAGNARRHLTFLACPRKVSKRTTPHALAPACAGSRCRTAVRRTAKTRLAPQTFARLLRRSALRPRRWRFRGGKFRIRLRISSAFKPQKPSSIQRRIKLATSCGWQVALKQDASVVCSTAKQKRSRTTRSHAQRSAGRFFGDFLWTSKESYPAAGRHRRT
jgi:hypothetical protein